MKVDLAKRTEVYKKLTIEGELEMKQFIKGIFNLAEDKKN
ncbi:hypothetical protein SAMN02745151_00732 [[Clostridium] propionicum DSM 1682]|uniref:Uncharacterized protein n=1 Tax=Anaerotignum propionicum DSM 1682 TaxID=991789 RepID=A0A120MK69_ANAPI|nr:hypothetical protein CPRO_07470 [Anaerotignum propionicum DSM 1682]SHE44465.1 hypothetical protein SAMN02745151_00732 [[Clostridium] propionicum DSM 1682] [Anaerotignum propionicum DSM 1682]